MNRNILADRVVNVKLEELKALRELNPLYSPGRVMRTPGAERGKIYLTNGLVVTPRPGVNPGPITKGEVELARRYCPGVKLSDTPIAFGVFKGLTFGQVRALRAGDVVYDGKVNRYPVEQCESFNCLAHERGLAELPIVTVDSDTEGVRYLDRLLSEPWVYEVTKTRLALYLGYSNDVETNAHRDLLQAMGPVLRDGEGATWPSGGLSDGLSFPPYGDGSDGSLEPSDFSITGTPSYDPATGRDSWNGGSFEEGPWKGQGAPAFLAHPFAGRGAKVRRAEEYTALDPTPGNWRLDDPVRQERGDEDEDGWIDMQVVADNDVEWNWEPARPLTEFTAWQLGLDYVQKLERLGPCSHRTTTEAREALKELIGYEKEVRSDAECGTVKVMGEIHRRLGLLEGNKFRWHPLVSESLRKELTSQVSAAQERIAEWENEIEAEGAASTEAEQDRTASRNRWRGLDTLGRRKRVSVKRVKAMKQQAVGV